MLVLNIHYVRGFNFLINKMVNLFSSECKHQHNAGTFSAKPFALLHGRVTAKFAL